MWAGFRPRDAAQFADHRPGPARRLRAAVLREGGDSLDDPFHVSFSSLGFGRSGYYRAALQTKSLSRPKDSNERSPAASSPYVANKHYVRRRRHATPLGGPGMRRTAPGGSMTAASGARRATQPRVPAAGPGPNFQPDSGWIFGPKSRPFTQTVRKDFVPLQRGAWERGDSRPHRPGAGRRGDRRPAGRRVRSHLRSAADPPPIRKSRSAPWPGPAARSSPLTASPTATASPGPR